MPRPPTNGYRKPRVQVIPYTHAPVTEQHDAPDVFIGGVTLDSPANAAETTDRTPLLAWLAVNNATEYQVQADEDAAFGSPEIDELVNTISYAPSGDLAYEEYNWRVRVTQPFLSEWSAVRTFTVKPIAPAITAPTEMQFLNADQLTLEWDAVDDVLTYAVEIATDSGFSTIVDSDDAVATTSFDLSGLDPTDGVHYARVKVKTPVESEWSATVSFSLYWIYEDYPTDDAAPITSPQNGITYQRADLWEISGGVAQTTASATTGALPVAYVANGFTRAIGLAMAARVLQNPQGPGPNETISPAVGWTTAPGSVAAAQLSGLYFWSVEGRFAASEAGQSSAPRLLDANAVSTYYDLVHILRSTGSFSIVGDRLAFVHKQGNAATMYPSVGQAGLSRHPASIDYFNVAQLGGGWLDDYGLATTRLAGARSANDLFTHEANAFWCEFVLTTLPSAGSVLIDIRRQDANNKWQLEVASNGAFNLIEVVAGTPTQRAQITSNTNGDRLMCVMDGSQARLIRWRSEATAHTSLYTSVSTFTTQTQGEIISLGTGGAVSDLETYPRVIPPALYQWIEALRAA